MFGFSMASTPSETEKLPCPSCKSTNNVSLSGRLQLCKACECYWFGDVDLMDFAAFSAFSPNMRVHSTPATSTPTSAAASSFSSDGINNNNNIAHELLYGNRVRLFKVPQMGSGSSPMTGSLMGCGMKVVPMEGSMKPPGEGNYAYLLVQGLRKLRGDPYTQHDKDYGFEGNNSAARRELMPDWAEFEYADFQNPAIGGTSHLHSTIHQTSNGPHPTVVILGPDSPMMPPPHPDDNKSRTESNNAILGMTGQAALALLLSSQSDSTSMRVFAAATGIGFLGSFFANYTLKNPKLARFLSKIGAIGASSAVIVALGLHFPTETKWKLDVIATAAACLITALVVATS